MPESKLDLGSLSSAIAGQEQKRGVKKEWQNPAGIPQTPKTPNTKGLKLKFRKEADLSSVLVVDYNPTDFPFSHASKINSSSIIGGEDSLEWQGTKSQEYTLNLFLTDYGYHGQKSPPDVVYSKLYWLEQAATMPEHQIIDGKSIYTPPILIMEKGTEAFRVIITRMQGKEIMNDPVTYKAIRARVQVTIRHVRMKGVFAKSKVKSVRPTGMNL